VNTPSATPGWSPDSGVPLQAKLKEDLKLALRSSESVAGPQPYTVHIFDRTRAAGAATAAAPPGP
jgi:hypothetical protein